ncbi:MAG: hypothetical protein ACREOU_06465 [Candidatus Eiseniibacteriota bacterium]
MCLQEKRAWIYLTIAGIYIPYFTYVYRLLTGKADQVGAVLGTLIGATVSVLLVLVEVGVRLFRLLGGVL